MVIVSRRYLSRNSDSASLVGQHKAGATSAKANAGAHEKVARSDRKAWAVEYFKGLETILPPSFSADFERVDEDAIRLDVRLAIAQGFFATLCSQYTVGLTRDMQKRVVEAACSEAGDKIQIGTAILEPLESAIEIAAHAERSGCTHILLNAPPPLYKNSEDELYNYYARVAESTSLAIVLQYYDDPLCRKWHPAGMSLKVFDRLAEIPNIVGIKLTQTAHPATAFELAAVLGDRLLIGPANLDLVPVLTRNCRMQWAGMFAADCIQAPQKPHAVEFMRLLNAKRVPEAMKEFWRFQPAHQAFYDLQAPVLRVGGHPWTHIKYYSWLIGGNGGLLRDLNLGDNGGLFKAADAANDPPLDAAGRKSVQHVFRAMNVTLENRPEEEFLVGREAYAKGVRPRDLKHHHGYS